MIKSKFFIVSTDEKRKWRSVLENIGEYDFYHLPEYHELHEKQGDGKACLLVYADGEKVAAFPLLVRRIRSIKGLEEFSDFYDATSVYGYPGPLASSGAKIDRGFMRSFQEAIKQYAKQNKWISIFTRMNPLLNNHFLLAEFGELVKLSQTVSIDLFLKKEEQESQYRKSHRYEIRRAKKNGMKVIYDIDWNYYNAFIKLYYDTMKRVEASSHYFFDKNYFSMLKEKLGNRLYLFVATMGEEVCAASLFVHTNNIIQYHLSATHENYKYWAPSKLIIDKVRVWGKKIEAKWLHLGGGVGSSTDSLFKFKAGFSHQRHPFYIWKFIVLPESYRILTEKRQLWKPAESLLPKERNYFPSYRN